MKIDDNDYIILTQQRLSSIKLTGLKKKLI